MSDLSKLVLQRVQELGAEAFSIHEDLMRWREPAYSDIDKTQLSVKLKIKLEEQCSWLKALEELEDKN